MGKDVIVDRRTAVTVVRARTTTESAEHFRGSGRAGRAFGVPGRIPIAVPGRCLR
jgi:hypothetical protein